MLNLLAPELRSPAAANEMTLSSAKVKKIYQKIKNIEGEQGVEEYLAVYVGSTA
jgi:hypothetical protein